MPVFKDNWQKVIIIRLNLLWKYVVKHTIIFILKNKRTAIKIAKRRKNVVSEYMKESRTLILKVTEEIEKNSNIEIIREEVKNLESIVKDGIVIIR